MVPYLELDIKLGTAKKTAEDWAWAVDPMVPYLELDIKLGTAKKTAEDRLCTPAWLIRDIVWEASGLHGAARCLLGGRFFLRTPLS